MNTVSATSFAMTRERRSRDGSTAYGAKSMRYPKDAEQTRAITPLSAVKTYAARKFESGQYPIPQIQGVVPGIRRLGQPASSSHSLAHSFISTASNVSVANSSFLMQDGTTICPTTNTTALNTTHSTTAPHHPVSSIESLSSRTRFLPAPLPHQRLVLRPATPHSKAYQRSSHQPCSVPTPLSPRLTP